MTTTLTSPKGRQASSSPSDGDYTRADVNLPFLSTDTGTYSVTSLHWAFCPVLGRWFWNGIQSQAQANNAAALNCGAAVTRNQTATCTVTNYGSATISNWQFTDGQSGKVTVTASTGTTANTWSGAAVQSGTVSTTVSYLPQPITASLTVNARTGWAFTAVSAVKVSNGQGTGACAGGLPVLVSPPTATSGEIGYSCAGLEWSYNYTSVSGGLNKGYWYTTSASSSGNSPTAYQWERVPDLDNTASTFYTKQTGTYNAQTDPSGCIGGSNLATQTQRHEIGLAQSNYIQSHWDEYRTALNSPSNNFGTIIEGSVGPPSQSEIQFKGGLNTALNNASNAILTAFQTEPYDVNRNEYDVLLGYINYAPSYDSCH